MEDSPAQEQNPFAQPHWRRTQENKWVLCGPQDVMKPGARVEIFRKDGSSSFHIIDNDPESIGKPFESKDDPNLMMVYVYKFEEDKDDK